MSALADYMRSWADCEVDVTLPGIALRDGADALDEWEARTGGLSPELVAKALTWFKGLANSSVRPQFTADEIAALRTARFEVPT